MSAPVLCRHEHCRKPIVWLPPIDAVSLTLPGMWVHETSGERACRLDGLYVMPAGAATSTAEPES